MESKGKLLIDEAKKLDLFVNVTSDYNKESLSESRKFYLETSSTKSHYHGSNSKGVPIIENFQGQKYVFPQNCRFFCYNVGQMTEKLDVNTNKYDFILMDPPWWNKSIRRKKMKLAESRYFFAIKLLVWILEKPVKWK